MRKTKRGIGRTWKIVRQNWTNSKKELLALRGRFLWPEFVGKRVGGKKELS